MFWGCKFVFDDVPCEDYDLMLYDVGGISDKDTEFAGVGEIQKDTIGTRWKPVFYGLTYDDQQEIELTFGVNTRRLDSHKYLDKQELDEIAAWLIGHDKYRCLEIIQDDMRYLRFKCIVTEMKVIPYGSVEWAIRATFTCDGPYGYMYPQSYVFNVSDSATIEIYNESSYNGYYYPIVKIENASGSVSIVNNTDDTTRAFSFTDLPNDATEIVVDNDNRVITSDSSSNLYECFNFNFLRLRRGYNQLAVTGSCKITLTCEYPINLGG